MFEWITQATSLKEMDGLRLYYYYYYIKVSLLMYTA